MKKIVFTEEFCQPENLFPFTLTRQIQDIRMGILTIREKWERSLGYPSFDKKEGDYKDLGRAIDLSDLSSNDTVLLIHGNVLPTPSLLKQVKKLKHGECLGDKNGETIIYCITEKDVIDPNRIKISKSIELSEPPIAIKFPWEIFQLNARALELDFAQITSGRKSSKISKTNRLVKSERIFIEKGARVEHCIINASSGPVYIDAGAEIMEGSMIRGPVSIGKNAVVKMGAKIYGATTIGPGCVVGGEIKNSVLFEFSNKSHDGYLGDSVVGAWCNFGAGTSNSNLKNNVSDIFVFTPRGRQLVGKKCGLIMGDYSRTAINTSINTGTVVGVSAHLMGNGLTPKFIPCFAWGSEGIERYRFEKAIQDIAAWKKLKEQTLTEEEITILKNINARF